MTQRRPSGRPQHRAGRCVCPQPTGRQQLPAEPCAGRSCCQRAKMALTALPPPEPHISPVQDPISLSPGVTGPQQHCSRTGIQLPTALPGHRQHVLGQPQPVPGVPPGLGVSPGRAEGQSLAAQLPSSTAISTGHNGGSCQQPVRLQKHPGTILAEENRKSSWSCCKAPTATSMAFTYF